MSNMQPIRQTQGKQAISNKHRTTKTYKVERIKPVRRGGELHLIAVSRYTYPVIRAAQAGISCG